MVERRLSNSDDIQDNTVVAADIPGAVLEVGGNDRQVFHRTQAITGTAVIATGLTSVLSAQATLQTAPGNGAGDPFLVRCEPDVPGAGDVTVTVYQDDATVAANPGTVQLLAYGT